MDPGTIESPSPAILESNLDSLEKVAPQSAKVLRIAPLPDAGCWTLGRDGTPTYAWPAVSGRMEWLGRITMPRVRAGALIDAFQPGGGNVLLVGIGQGAEISALLPRLAPHQAAFVIEENAAAASLVLRLHDFADHIRAGRLVVLAGPDAWDQLAAFLESAPGYLAPDRILAWPWFDAAMVSGLSDRLSAINAAASRSRAEARRRPAPPRRRPPRREPAIAVVSNVADPRIRLLAEQLTMGAEALGWSCRKFVLDDPAMVHPLAVETALAAFGPTALILLDVGPSMLPYPLPQAPVFLWLTGPPAHERLSQLEPFTKLGVFDESCRSQCVAAGINSSRILLLPPAALPQPEGNRKPESSRVLVVADDFDLSAEACGLHLSSHAHLWDAARAILADRLDTYDDSRAEELLRAAERRLGVRLDSAEVRDGLVERIRCILGPVLVRRACLKALLEAGIDFDLVGAGWKGDSPFASRHRGGRPAPRETSAFLDRYGMIVSIETSGAWTQLFLDGLAAGLAGVVRAHSHDAAPHGLAAVLDPRKYLWQFQTPAKLAEIAGSFINRTVEFLPRAAAAAKIVSTSHTWAARLESIARELRLSSDLRL